jgi:heme/copper-type cytochrome/quinol oxidase subunit 4
MYRTLSANIPLILPIRMADLETLPRKLMAGTITVVMGLVVIVIGVVIFGSTTGIAAYIDKIFGDLGVKANITQTVNSLNMSTVFTVIGIVIVVVGFALILMALIEMGKSAQGLWKE